MGMCFECSCRLGAAAAQIISDKKITGHIVAARFILVLSGPDSPPILATYDMPSQGEIPEKDIELLYEKAIDGFADVLRGIATENTTEYVSSAPRQ